MMTSKRGKRSSILLSLYCNILQIYTKFKKIVSIFTIQYNIYNTFIQYFNNCRWELVKNKFILSILHFFVTLL